MPATLTTITHMGIHISDGGVADIAVWFTDGYAPGQKVTFNCFDILDYETFCSRILEVTGHLFFSAEVEEAQDPWAAKLKWRRYIRELLESANVDVRAGAHWRPLELGITCPVEVV